MASKADYCDQNGHMDMQAENGGTRCVTCGKYTPVSKKT